MVARCAAMPGEFLSDEQAAEYSRFTGSLTRAQEFDLLPLVGRLDAQAAAGLPRCGSPSLRHSPSASPALRGEKDATGRMQPPVMGYSGAGSNEATYPTAAVSLWVADIVAGFHRPNAGVRATRGKVKDEKVS